MDYINSWIQSICTRVEAAVRGLWFNTQSRQQLVQEISQLKAELSQGTKNQQGGFSATPDEAGLLQHMCLMCGKMCSQCVRVLGSSVDNALLQHSSMTQTEDSLLPREIAQHTKQMSSMSQTCISHSYGSAARVNEARIELPDLLTSMASVHNMPPPPPPPPPPILPPPSTLIPLTKRFNKPKNPARQRKQTGAPEITSEALRSVRLRSAQDRMNNTQDNNRKKLPAFSLAPEITKEALLGVRLKKTEDSGASNHNDLKKLTNGQPHVVSLEALQNISLRKTSRPFTPKRKDTVDKENVNRDDGTYNMRTSLKKTSLQRSPGGTPLHHRVEVTTKNNLLTIPNGAVDNVQD